MTDQEYIDKFVEAHKPFAKFGVTLYKVTKIESITDESKESKVYDNYWTLGMLKQDVMIGSPIIMARVANIHYPNGRDGIFQTSTVIDYKDGIATTKNSKYKVEKLV